MEQTKALEILKAGKNVFLTGSAGTGKTYVLNQYIQYLKNRKVPVAVTASTGIAATHMNGMTIHSWAGIGVKEHISDSQLKLMKGKKYLKDNLENVKVLIIDEISMLHRNQVSMVNQVLKYFNDPFKAFGGIQVVFSGDFFQLPPVGNRNESNKDKFAFMSPAWVEAGLAVCYLTKQYRQTDQELNNILNEIRGGKVSEKSIRDLVGTKENKKDKLTTKLYTHNMDVDSENLSQLKTLTNKNKTFKATTKGNEKLVEVLKKSVLASHELDLKVGAKVMFVRNNPEKNYVNGTLGTIIDFNEDGWPVVETKDSRKIIAEPVVWSVNDDGGKALASLEQVPLRLAWAITIHKSQGVTLEEASIDLSKTFERGQGYVALSRLKQLEGLHLSGFNSTALEVDALAFKADKRFLELSGEAVERLKSNELEKSAKQFLIAIGGLTDEKEIKKYKNKREEKKSKLSTHEITKKLIEEGKTIKEMVEIRDLAENTIIQHLLTIKEKFPSVDLQRFKPKDLPLQDIQKAYEQVKEKEKKKADYSGYVSLKLVFDALKGKVNYEDIKLAMLFFKD